MESKKADWIGSSGFDTDYPIRTLQHKAISQYHYCNTIKFESHFILKPESETHSERPPD